MKHKIIKWLSVHWRWAFHTLGYWECQMGGCESIFKLTTERAINNGVWKSFRGRTYWLCDECIVKPEIKELKSKVTKSFLQKEANLR